MEQLRFLKSFVFAWLATMIFTSTLHAQRRNSLPRAEISDQEFLEDIADRVSLRNDLNVSIAVQVEAGDQGALTEYSYKIGPFRDTRCRRQSGYSEFVKTTENLQVDLSSYGDETIRLCLLGRVMGGSEQSLRNATTYRWRRRALLQQTRIIAPRRMSSTQTPEVMWREVREAVSYDLQVSLNPDCSAPIQEYFGLSATSQTLSPLADGTHYACVFTNFANNTRVAASNNPHSWEQVAEPLPGAFSITGPGSPSIIKEPIVTWESSVAAETYNLIVASDESCSSPVQSYEDLIDTQQQLTTLNDGTYYVCVTAINANGQTEALNNGYSFVQAATPPGSFAITAPMGLSSNPTPTVAWESSEGAQSYNLIVASNASCSAIVQSYEELPGTSQTLTALSDGVYYACVTASNPAGTTNASNNGFSWTQLTQEPGEFNITAPNSPSTTNMPIISWTESETADSYDLVVSQNVDCSNPVAQFSNLTLTSQQVGPLDDGVYFACVTAKNAIGSTTASNDGYSWEQITESPLTFQILSPSGFVFTSTPIVEWQMASKATSYDLVVATDEQCSTSVQSYQDILTTSQELSPLAEGVYYACVTAKNAAGSTPANNNGLSWTFDVTAPGDFTITDPSEVQQVNQDVDILWTSATEADSYTVNIGTTSDCATNNQVYENLIENRLTVSFAQTGFYHVCIEAFDEAGNSKVATNSGDFVITVSAPSKKHLVFLTATQIAFDASGLYPPFTPWISSPEGADYECTLFAYNAGLNPDWDFSETNWKAIISTSSADAVDRIGELSGDIYNMNNELVAESKSDLFDGSLLAPIQYDENGNLVSLAPYAWTGSDEFGVGTGFDCDDWFSPTAGSATVGSAASTGSGWLNHTLESCSTLQRLYCISPPLDN